MKRIVWLASFPKSGNTWMRLLLANYFSPATDVDLPQLELGVSAAGRRLFDVWSTMDCSELSDDEIADGRGDLFRAIAAAAHAPVFFKTHEAWTTSPSGAAVFPSDVTLAVVYLVRHPHDVAVSLAHFLGLSSDAAVKLMTSDTMALCRREGGISVDLPQHVSSWHSNVSSWIEKSGLPLVVVKYEDLHADPAASLTTVLKAMGCVADPVHVERAVKVTSFARLQQNERARKVPNPSAAVPFFRGGRVGDGLRELTAEQRQTLTARHERVMRMLGYL